MSADARILFPGYKKEVRQLLINFLALWSLIAWQNSPLGLEYDEYELPIIAKGLLDLWAMGPNLSQPNHFSLGIVATKLKRQLEEKKKGMIFSPLLNFE